MLQSISGHFRWVSGKAGKKNPKKLGAQTYVKPNLVFFSFSVVMAGGGGSSKKKKKCSEFAETCSCFGIFEIRENFLSGGGGGGGGVKK